VTHTLALNKIIARPVGVFLSWCPLHQSGVLHAKYRRQLGLRLLQAASLWRSTIHSLQARCIIAVIFLTWSLNAFRFVAMAKSALRDRAEFCELPISGLPLSMIFCVCSLSHCRLFPSQSQSLSLRSPSSSHSRSRASHSASLSPSCCLRWKSRSWCCG
jgi:hypothetical protein